MEHLKLFLFVVLAVLFYVAWRYKANMAIAEQQKMVTSSHLQKSDSLTILDKNKNPELEWKDTLILSAEDIGYSEEKEEKIKLLEKVLTQITDKCRKIFELFYFKKEDMNTIARELDFTSVNSAKTQKYKCMERAIELARQMTGKELQTTAVK